MVKKIDIHCHTTNRKVEKVMPASATIEAVIEKMKEHEIEKTVLLASYFPHRSSGISNFRLLHWLQDRNNKDKFYFFGSLDFEHYFNQGINELRELAESDRLDGIKIYTGYQKINLDSSKFSEIVNLAKKYYLPMMFHCGYSYMARRKYNKDSIEKMIKASDLEFIVKKNPEINVIVSHLSKPFFNDIAEVAKRNNNVYTDMSGLVNSKYDKNERKQVIEGIKMFLGECSADKLLFGTDFPVQTHEDSIYFIEEAMKSFSEEDKGKVYYDNAKKILNSVKSWEENKNEK